MRLRSFGGFFRSWYDSRSKLEACPSTYFAFNCHALPVLMSILNPGVLNSVAGEDKNLAAGAIGTIAVLETTALQDENFDGGSAIVFNPRGWD